MKVAIASGKGGTGKTLVSTNLFWSARVAGKKVTLVDCDAEEPNVAEFITGDVVASRPVIQKVPVIDADKCTFCGKCSDYCSYHAIICLPGAEFIQVVEELCHDCGACLVACENGAITEKEKQIGFLKTVQINESAWVIEGTAEIGVYSPVPVIKKAIALAGEDGFLIFDAPPGISCPFIATVEPADFVVLVTEPTPFGFNDLKLSAETLCHLKKPFGVIVNRSGLGDNTVYQWMQDNKIPLLMDIPFSREIARIYSEGKVLADVNPDWKNQFLTLFETLESQVNL